jgi:hypothetical protein
VKLEKASQKDLQWIVERTQCWLTGGARGIKCVDDSGKIRGMVAYDLWTVNSCQAHMAVDTPIAWRRLIPEVFRYPFVQAGKGVIIGAIPSINPRSMDTARSLGFRETYRVTDGWSQGEDMVLFEMRKDECRWLGNTGRA